MPATQHSLDKHVAAAHVFELGLSINTCGAIQPVNPTHAGAEEKGENGEMGKKRQRQPREEKNEALR